MLLPNRITPCFVLACTTVALLISRELVLAAEPRSAPITIAVTRHSPTLDYAASELCKYLVRMAANRSAATVIAPEDASKASLRLGVFSDLGLPLDGLKDPAQDDAIHVAVQGSKGVVAGSNERSVLFAVYRFLESTGCRWLRPGKDGEIVPTRPVHDLTVQLADRPHYRFRGNNNCGTYGVEDILAQIEWAPKVGLNTWFNEFTLPKRLYNRWYAHSSNPLKTPEPRSDEEILAYHEKTVEEIKRRGLNYHACGHGWTGAALGLTDSQANDEVYQITGSAQKLLAELHGERKTHTRGPIFTELCYGNPEVRQRMTRVIVDHAAAHPEIDVIHVWLSDGTNNQCECDRCRDTRPADFYLMILNDVDRQLTQRKLSTRIAFLLYHELLWPPEKQRFENPDRFVLMFAPGGRDYGQPYSLEADGSELPVYVRNQIQLPLPEPRTYVAFLRAWQRVFPGDGFAFDYQFVWHHYFDQGYYGMVAVLAEDIRRLQAIGLGGYVSCQNLRAAFPTNYPKYMHARLLWNPQLDVELAARDFFQAAFGTDAETCRQYMSQLSDLFDAPATHRFVLAVKKDKQLTAPPLAAKLARVPMLVDQFRPVIDRNLSASDNKVQALSWRYVALHADLATALSQTLRAKAEGNAAAARFYGEQAAKYVAVHDDDTQPAFDLWYFFSTMTGRGVLRPLPTP